MISNYSYPEPEKRTSRPVDFDLTKFFGAEKFTLGVDLGQSKDSTALALVKRVEQPGGKPIFQVGHLARLPLGMPYPAQVETVCHLLTRPQLRGKTELVIDYTGVGRPVYDLFCECGVTPVGVTITGGHAVTHEGLIWSVPKGHLISRIQALLHSGHLKIHKDLPDAPVLVSELQTMQADFSETGHMRFNARSGAHDDLVLALGISLWKAYGEATSGAFTLFMRQAFGLAPKQSAEADKSPPVNIRCPLGTTSTIYTMDGRALNIGSDGTFLVSHEQAKPLLAAGWIVAEPAETMA
jgi:hypothetical protein